MKATKSQILKVSKYLWQHGHGSKKALAEKIGKCPAEITRFLATGKTSEANLKLILDQIK